MKRYSMTAEQRELSIDEVAYVSGGCEVQHSESNAETRVICPRESGGGGSGPGISYSSFLASSGTATTSFLLGAGGSLEVEASSGIILAEVATTAQVNAKVERTTTLTRVDCNGNGIADDTNQSCLIEFDRFLIANDLREIQ